MGSLHQPQSQPVRATLRSMAMARRFRSRDLPPQKALSKKTVGRPFSPVSIQTAFGRGAGMGFPHYLGGDRRVNALKNRRIEKLSPLSFKTADFIRDRFPIAPFPSYQW